MTNLVGFVEGSATAHTLVLGNLLANDKSRLYLASNSGFDISLPITVFSVVSTRLGTDITFKDVIPAAYLRNFSVPKKAVGNAAFQLTAPISNSAGTFSYTSSDPSVATVNGSTVTIVGAGTSFITATQTASGNYAANSVTAF